MERRATRIGVREIELQSEVAHLARQLADVERKERELLDVYLDEGMPKAALRTRLADLATKREGLRERLQRAEAKATAQRAAEGQQQAIERCEVARRGLDKLDATERHRLLTLVVEEIIVRGRDVEVHGILPAASPSIELSQQA